MRTTAFSVSPLTADDVADVVELYASIEEECGIPAIAKDEVRDWLNELDDSFTVVVARDGGDAVGTASLWDANQAHERLFLGVRARACERGIYERLLDWGEGRARELAGKGPARLRSWTQDSDEALSETLSARGYELVRHFLTMEIDLATEPAQPAWPQGIRLRTFRPDDARRVYEADSEAFADHWDSFDLAFEDWRKHFLESSSFDPTLWFLAEDGDEIAGFALCRGERRPDTGHVGVLGVRRPWRRRGLGTALLLHSFHQLRRRGRAKADLGVDAENLTGAVALYERAGMRPVRRSDTYERRVP